jgi:uncharacterized protein YjbI with pentapeptide repeats
LQGTDLSGALLTGAGVSRAQLAMAKSLKDATLPGGQSYEIWLVETSEEKSLPDAAVHPPRRSDLRGADLRERDLRGADLADADLQGTNLGGADLAGADLRGARLIGANLSQASLLRADLRGADLIAANLRGADLRGAILEGALVTEAQLDAAESLDGAVLPDGRALL